MALAPQDEAVIEDFIEGVRDFRRLELPVDLTASDALEFAAMGREMLPILLPTLRWSNVTLAQFAQRFKDPFLREALLHFFQFAPPDFPMMLCLSTLALMHDQEAGYPIGGSLPIAEALEKRYLELGGEVVYDTRVIEILVQNDHAIGLKLEGGENVYGDIAISAADGHQTVYNLLNGRYVNNKITDVYEGGMTPSKSILQVSFGVALDFSDQPPMVNIPLDSPVWLGNVRHDRLVLKHYCFDPTMAPPGKSVLSLWCEADYAYWQWLRRDMTRYDQHKAEVAEVILKCLEKRYPGLSTAVEVIDVATPTTYERYTGNWRGAFAGWAMTTRKMSMMMGIGMDKTLPGLEGFYRIGHWVEPGGNVELSCASGRDVIKDICETLNQEFYTGLREEI